MKKLLPLGLAIVSTFAGMQAHAASQTWNSTGASTAWNSSTNWGGSTAPGNATSGATTTTDTGTFNTAVGTVGTSGNPITINSGLTLGGITFDSANVGAFTIGTTGVGTLFLSSGGSGIAMTATGISSNETINAPLAIGTGSGAATGTFQNNSTGAGTLTIGGSVTGTTTGAVTLTLEGSNTGANTVSGAIGNGSSSALSVSKSGAGTWVLSGASSYTGSTTVGGGTLAVTNASGLGSTSSVTLSRGTLSLLNDGTGSNGTINYGYNIFNSITGTINVDHNTSAHTGNTIQLGNIANGSTLTVTNGDGYNLTFTGTGSFTQGATFANNMVSGTLTLPNLTESDTGGTKGINFTGLSASGVTVVGGISPNTDSVALNLWAAGTLEMTGDSTYAGATTINEGTLELNNSTGAALGSSAVTFLGGTLADIGSSTSNPTSATLVTLTAGSNGISTSSTTGHVLALGTVSRALDTGVVNFTPYSTTVGANGSITTSTGTNSLGILGGWATVTTASGVDWATLSGSTVVAYSGYTALPTTGTGTATNYQLTNGSGTTTLTGSLNIGSLKITDSGTTSVINTGANSLSISQNASGAGGLLMTGGGSFTINGTGAVGAGLSGGSEFIIDVTGNSTLTINNPVNATAAGASGFLTKTGTGTLVLTAANSGFIGGVNIDGGDVQASTLANTGSLSSIGSSGNIVLNGGALTYVGGTVSTNRVIQLGPDGGEIDSSGSGALTVTSSTQINSTITAGGTTVLTLGGTNTGANTLGTVIGSVGSNTTAVTKTGVGTWILTATDTYTGPTTINGGLLDINGSTAAGSAVSINNGGALGGTGTVSGAVALNSGGSINMVDGTIGTLHIGSLSTSGGGAIDFDITTGTSGNLDLLTDAAAFTATGTTGINITNLGGTGSLTLSTGTYNLITSTSALSLGNFDFASNSTDTMTLDGKTLTLTTSGDNLEVVVSGGATFTTGTYTLTTTVGSALLHVGATTTATTTLTNTGTGSADSLNYTGLGSTGGTGTVTGTAGAGGPVANAGGTAVATQTYTALTAGTDTVTPTGTVTGANSTPTPVDTGTSTATIQVYSGTGSWTGTAGGVWGTAESSAPANWTATGGIPGITPGFLTTDSASFGNSSTTQTITLSGASPYLNNITFNNTLAGSYTIAQGGTGTIHLENSGTSTATLVDSAGSNTISAPVELDSAASTSVATSDTLTISGNVSQGVSAEAMTIGGAGTTVLSGSNTYTGGTTVNGTATLLVSNTTAGGSATGTGALTVSPNGTIGGYGTSSGTSFNVAGSGTTTGTRANILVGLNSASDTNTSHVLTLVGSSTSTITNANLTFNLSTSTHGALGSDPSGSGTELSIGNTKLTFGGSTGSVLFTLNMQNEPGIVTAYTPYVLIAGTLPTGGGGVDGSQYTGLTLGNVLVSTGTVTETIIDSNGTNNLAVAFGNSTDQGYYGANSYLVLYQNTVTGADDIDVVVVPEPGTWALMLGGLAFLVFWQRRKSSR